MNPLNYPDLGPITNHVKSVYRSRLLVAAVSHLKVFDKFSEGSLTSQELQNILQLKDRPFIVLVSSLCSMQLLSRSESGVLFITELGHALISKSVPNLVDYIGLEGEDSGVLEMVHRLQNDGPLDTSKGISYLKEENVPSPMDSPDSARFLTLALSGRARLLAPLVARHMPKMSHLLDIACGTGLYTFEWLLQNPSSTATLLDTESVLIVADEILKDFCKTHKDPGMSLRKRVTFLAGDMFHTPLPPCDLLLAASVLHDWPESTCLSLTKRLAGAINPGGELWLHNSFLNDNLDGPLEIADYSTSLFWITKGRCYSKKEYRSWMVSSGLQPSENFIPTGMDYGLISAKKI